MGVPERKTVIVVGAGASKEFELPTGAELMEQLQRLADVRFADGYRRSSGEYEVEQTFRAMAAHRGSKDINDLLKASWAIRDNMPLAPSIDNFMHSRASEPLLVEVGKVLISRAISKAEKASTLYVDHVKSNTGPRFDHLSKTWAAQLFKLMVSAGDFSTFIRGLENTTFVSFNYDRCIEQFIVNAAKSYFASDEVERETVCGALKILHPYGSLGPLVWRNPARNGFGSEPVGADLYEISKGIRTFTEGLDSETQKAVTKALYGADVLVFLGFAYHPLNMELMSSDSRFEIRNVFGTSKGLSEDSRERVKHDLQNVFLPSSGAGNVRLENLKAFELFDHFGRFFLKS